MLKEIIISHRIPIETILKGEVNHIIRISEKNKWKPGSIFYLKCSHKDPESIKVIIEESTEQVAKYISVEVLIKMLLHKQREIPTAMGEMVSKMGIKCVGNKIRIITIQP